MNSVTNIDNYSSIDFRLALKDKVQIKHKNDASTY